MESSTSVIAKSLTPVLEKGFWIINSLLEKNVFIVISQEGKYLPFPDKREERRN